MADTETTEPEVEDQEESADAENSSSSGISLDGLNSKVDNLIGKVEALLKGGPKRTTKADEAADVAAQVRSEVGKLKSADQAEAKRTGRMADLEAKVKQLTEVAPVEYRRITTLLWGDPDS